MFRTQSCHTVLIPGRTSRNLPQTTIPLKNEFRQGPPAETICSRHRHAGSFSHAKHQALLFRSCRPHLPDFQIFSPHRHHIYTNRSMQQSVLHVFLKAGSDRYTYPVLIHHPNQQMRYMRQPPLSVLYFLHRIHPYVFREIP